MEGISLLSNEFDPAKKYSKVLTEGPDRAAARSYFRSVGFSKEDLHKPIIGIANTWTEVGPCNFHLRKVAEAVKQGVREAGGTPMEFNTITIHDGITMGTQGMKASLISREVIADSIELVTRGNSFDGIVCIAGCDKNMPAAIMALARLDIPGLMLYGGSIAPGSLKQPDGTTKEITILQVFEGMGAHAAGKINDEELEALEASACPGPGACGGQFTANTMAMAGEFLGISPMQITGVPAMSPEKHEASRQAGRLIMDLARAGLTPRKIINRQAIDNAIAAVAASGGSTNAVLHLIAIARELDIPLTMEDFDRISERTPFICDLSPGGKYAAKDYQDAGGSRLLAKRLLEKGLLAIRERSGQRIATTWPTRWTTAPWPETAADVVAGRSYRLLEALAGRLASALLIVDPRLEAVEVTVRKLRPPLALDVGSTGVRVRRAR